LQLLLRVVGFNQSKCSLLLGLGRSRLALRKFEFVVLAVVAQAVV
jgi:hypothetical protein